MGFTAWEVQSFSHNPKTVNLAEKLFVVRACMCLQTNPSYSDKKSSY